MKITPYFSQNPLDRLDNFRADKQKFLKLLNSSHARFFLFDGKEILIDKKGGYFFTKNDIKEFNTQDLVLLGIENDTPYFALHVKNKTKLFDTIGVRNLANSKNVNESHLGIIAQAVSILQWHNSHQFCSSCGKQTTLAYSGWRRDCTSCKKEHFPRTDPVVIMLVTHGDFCLVGRGVNFEANRFSCLAGYMESGESIEDAAKRELFEEAGVIGTEVTYIASQPWPFPTTLMIGVHVKALSKELVIDKNEIADAKWISKEQMKAILAGDESFGIKIPNKIAIARNLLEYWVES
jgi:NAD+ diphosphatase